MFDPRSRAKKVAAPVTGRLDRYVEAVVEHVHAAKQEILDEIAESEARQAERHFTLTARINALESALRAEHQNP